MASEKFTKTLLKNDARDLVTDLQDLIRMIDDSDYDLVDIDIKIDRINRENQLKEILENCDDY